MAFGDNATVYGVRGQIFHCSAVILNSTTANPLTGGLSNLALNISKDGAAFGAAAGTVTEIGTTGFVQLVFTAADMTANIVIFNVTSSTSNAVYATGEIRTVSLAEFAGRAADQTVKRVEQYLTDIWGFEHNAAILNRATGTFTSYEADSSTTKLTGTLTDTGAQGIATKGKMS